MNQVEEDSLYHSLGEEAIDVDCLLVEPRSDQVSVSGVWCFEDNLRKSVKTEDGPFSLGIPCSDTNAEGVHTAKLNAHDVLPHEVGVGGLLTENGVSPCDDYLLDVGYGEHGACMDYVSNELLHVGDSGLESPFPVFSSSEKGSFGIQNSLTESIVNSGCQNYFLGKTMCDFENKFDDYSTSFIEEENNEDTMSPGFTKNGVEITPSCQDLSTNSAKDLAVGAVSFKRSRKPTKRYIDESSTLSLMKCKKRREVSVAPKVKISGVGRPKKEVEPKEKEEMESSEIYFAKAIQVPFISQSPAEVQKKNSPPPDAARKMQPATSPSPVVVRKLLPAISPSPVATIENRIENYSSESDDDSETMIRSIATGNQRKLHRVWSVSEVKKLIDGVAHFGVGKWTHIKKLLFSSSVHRTPVDLKDKWRNLLKASCALKGSGMEDEQKRSQPWRPLPKSILCRVRELASAYPYPREGNSKISKSKFPLAHHVSSPARIKGNKVPVV
uniref:uncharacterized protein LOC122583999 n=1 Tax=Erigeron canadensis TaxID=72917 RepID=UPI001CB8D495|nr:uncharacterized protein LOC122583999 [Erigeron canadensis]